MRIKNVIFDIGGVLLLFNPREYLKKHLGDHEQASRLYQAVFRSDEWKALDRGTIGEKEAIEKMCEKHPELADSIREIMGRIVDIFVPIEGTINIMKKLKEGGYGIYLLTNFHADVFEKVKKKFEFFNLVDGGVVSSHVKLLKPEREIYECIIRRYSLDPLETVFIDDTLENVEGAKSVGLHAILFESPLKLKEELKRLGVSVD